MLSSHLKRSRRTKLLPVLVLAVICAGLVWPAQNASALLVWRSGDGRRFRTTAACRNGLVLQGVYEWGTGPKPEGIPNGAYYATEPISVSLYRNTWLDREPSGEPIVERYGPRLASVPLLILYQDPPLVADIFGGNNPQPYHLYGTATMLWSRLLDISDQVVVRAGNAFWQLQVRDCYLNKEGQNSAGQLAVDEGARATIGSDMLHADYGARSSGAMRYNIERAPEHGSLLLNGTALGAGGTFTQDDVDNNRLAYAHNGDEPVCTNPNVCDSFAFSVSGTVAISVDASGNLGNGSSGFATISPNSYAVAFESDADNLVPGDTRDTHDVFVFNRATNTMLRASIAEDGGASNGGSTTPSLGYDGQYVAFVSDATDLASFSEVPCGGFADQNNRRDVFVRKLFKQSLNESDPYTARYSIRVLRDGNGNVAECIEANDHSSAPSLASFARSNVESEVAFQSDATNLVDGGVGGASSKIFARNNDSFSGIRHISIGANDAPPDNASSAPAVSGDLNYVAFVSSATNLVPGVTAGDSQIYVRDDIDEGSSGSQTVLLSHGFDSEPGNGASSGPAISADGRYVSFSSQATNLVPGNTNGKRTIFVADRGRREQDGFSSFGPEKIIRVSDTYNRAPIDGHSFGASISADGRFVAFASDATNLVAGDTNNKRDVFIHDRDTDGDGIFDEITARRTTRVSVASNSTQGNGNSFVDAAKSLSFDGSYVVFGSDATNLVADDNNGARDIFVYFTGYRSEFHISVRQVTDAPPAPPAASPPTTPPSRWTIWVPLADK